jgi:hypothetical protein
MLVKGWTRRPVASLYVLRHWQPAAPSDAWRGHFNTAAWVSHQHPMPSGLFKAAAPGQSSTPTLPSPFSPTVVLHTTAERR